ncbi:hypothetical protein J5500_03780 [Candidatus Saccharibacteria bacterium]|nr:hypothetical protein [Candidatus Saccharibacteria bacterium]
MSEKIKSAWPHVVFKVCIFTALIITSAYLIIAGFDTVREYHFGYKENGNIDYTVNLKDGNFLNETSLASGEIYYADSIDSIEALFQYGADFTDEVSGDYTYYLVATVSAEKDNGQKYWTKSVQVTDAVTKTITNSKKLRIQTKQLFYYLPYKQILQDFIDQYQAPASGMLRLSLVVRGDFTTEVMDRKATLESSIDLTSSLSDESIEFAILSNTKNDGKLYTKRVNIDSDRHRFCRFAGALLVIAVIYLAVALIHSAAENRKKHYYEYTVNKFREDFDSIIVDLKSAPKLSHLHIANVRAFDELLDVYNSVKQPINYFESKDGAHFILINGRLAWQYIVPKAKSLKRSAPKRRSSRRRK